MAARTGTGWIQAGAILAGLSVVLGAFAAHGLEKPLMSLYAGQTHEVLGVTIPSAQKYLGDFRTAAEYQMTHSLGMIAVGLLLQTRRSKCAHVAGICFLIGILLFSGSLYTLVLTGTRWLGAITPFGGVTFLIGWGALCLAATGASGRDVRHEDRREEAVS